MAAHLTDKFRKGAPFFQTTLAGSISPSDTSFNLASTTGLPTDTALDLVIDRIDVNGNELDVSLREIMTVTINGTTATTSALARGLDGTLAQSHNPGAVVEINFTSATWNDHIDGLLTGVNQDGTLKADQITGAGGSLKKELVEPLTANQIAANAVDTSQIKDKAVTAAKMDDTGWLPIAPETGYTSVDAYARRIGGVIYLRGQLSKTSGNVAVNDRAGTLPVGCRPNYETITCGFISNSSNFFKGVINNLGDYGITVLNQISGSSGTYIRLDSISFPEKD